MFRTRNRFLPFMRWATGYNVVHCTNWACERDERAFSRSASRVDRIRHLMDSSSCSGWIRNTVCVLRVPLLRKLLSDYMRDMYYTTQPMEMPDDIELLETTFRAMNAETQLLWSSDYPHWDGYPVRRLGPALHHLSMRKGIFWRTAQKIFRSRQQRHPADEVWRLNSLNSERPRVAGC